MSFDAIAWITEHLSPTPTTAAAFLYERMASQSGRSLPIIYQPFDATRRDHWRDRGQIYDFAMTVGPGRILDIGPGDGWPSLPLAGMVDEVVGVDPSPLRVQVCRDNAARLGIENATFVLGGEDGRLPFDDSSFDGVAAASSIEQCPDPKRLLGEILRVLRPGGKLRMHFEGIGRYTGVREREVELLDAPDGAAHMLLFDRHIAGECVDHIGLALDATRHETLDLLGVDELAFGDLDVSGLQCLSHHVVETGAWRTRHPSCETWLRWLGEVGFSDASATKNGGDMAVRMFWAGEYHPTTLNSVENSLRALARWAARQPVAYGPDDPWITARKG